MAPKKNTKKNKNKLIANRPTNTLRQYFPSLVIKYNQHISQLPTETKSTDENIMSVFRIMWNTNMLLKNILNKNSDSEARHDNKIYVDALSVLKDTHKTIWKLNSLIIYKCHFQT